MIFVFTTQGYGLATTLVVGIEGFHLAFGINSRLRESRWRFVLWSFLGE